MDVTIRDVVPPDSGHDLPPVVRQNLVDLGVAANQIALAVNQASQMEIEQLTVEDASRALRGTDSYITATAAQLATCVEDYHEQLVVAYSLLSTRYAVYVTQVAADVAAGHTPITETVDDVLPSQLLADFDRYLPPVTVTAPYLSDKIIDDQNRTIRESRDALRHFIARQMFGVTTEYDTIIPLGRTRSSTDMLSMFPAALHDYAGNLAWSIGVVTSRDQEPAY